MNFRIYGFNALRFGSQYKVSYNRWLFSITTVLSPTGESGSVQKIIVFPFACVLPRIDLKSGGDSHMLLP